VRVSPEFFEDVEKESKALAEHIRAGCRALPNPTPESVFDHVHVDMPDELRAQRTEFSEFVASIQAEVSA
jgi:2-oxoisovalerate dehydrogenase E1 component alpha subunit